MKQNHRIWYYSLIVSVILLILSNSCKKDETGPVPLLTTNNVTNITFNSATCGGSITSDEGSTVTARGVCWNTSGNPTITDSHTSDGIATGSFTSSLTGLIASTTYFVRAYATNGNGTGYGSTRSFTTLEIVTDIDGNVYHTVNIGTDRKSTRL
ncbi:MAG: hypothetical protein NTW49_10260, partial [Bacteroidia bacterium]|nr:hypothetical protein [Bacteroidia bacterium]